MREKEMNRRKISPICNVDKAISAQKILCRRQQFAVCFAVIRHSPWSPWLPFPVCMAADCTRPTPPIRKNGWRITCAALVELYRHLHQNPELSQKEKETSARMAKELRDRRHQGHDQRRRLRRRRRARKRSRQSAAAAFRHGRAARRRANRPAVCVESSHDQIRTARPSASCTPAATTCT